MELLVVVSANTNLKPRFLFTNFYQLRTYRHIRLCNHVIHNLFLVVFKSLATPDYIFKCKFSSYMILKNQL